MRTVPLAVQVETRGEFTTGMLVGDRRPLSSDVMPAANVHVALEVAGARFLELFLGRLHA